MSDLPPFSPVLDRLLATLSSEGISISRISEIIEKDTVIAGNVLKLVNSALYGRRGTVNSIRHAVSLLGINKLRNAVFAMSITRLWNKVKTVHGWSTGRFNLHSVACGLLCDCLAQRVSVEYPEGAFAAGLFHDLGELLIAITLHDESEEIQRLHESGFGTLSDCEREVLGVMHPELSAEGLALWNLPVAIQRAVRFHHSPDSDDANVSPAEYKLALIVQCADRYVEEAGMSLLNKPETGRELPPNMFAPLGLDVASANFIEEFNLEMAALQSVFLQGNGVTTPAAPAQP